MVAPKNAGLANFCIPQKPLDPENRKTHKQFVLNGFFYGAQAGTRTRMLLGTGF